MIHNTRQRPTLVLLLILVVIEFNPPANWIMRAGQALIVMGDVTDIAKAKRVF